MKSLFCCMQQNYLCPILELDGCENCGGGGRSNCVNIYNPDNGYTGGQCTPGIVSQTCTFFCNSGFSLEGDSRLTCLAGGRWSTRTPVCRRTSGEFDIPLQQAKSRLTFYKPIKIQHFKIVVNLW